MNKSDRLPLLDNNLLNKISMGISFFLKKRFSPFKRHFPYTFAMKFQRWHWLGNFAWSVEMTFARDAKIEVID